MIEFRASTKLEVEVIVEISQLGFSSITHSNAIVLLVVFVAKLEIRAPSVVAEISNFGIMEMMLSCHMKGCILKK